MNHLSSGDMFELLSAAVIGVGLLILGTKVFGGGLLTAWRGLSGRV